MARSGLMILRYAMISCFAFEMSRTISSLRPSYSSSSIRSSLCEDLVEDREAVVEEVVEDVVEQVARALGEQLVAQRGVLLAAVEEVRDRVQLDVGEQDQEVLADEDVELGGVQALDGLVVEREVEDDEEVVRVLVDLRPLPLREDVLDVELVEAEALGDERRLLRAWAGRRGSR